MKHALIAAGLLTLCGGCASYLFEGYPQTSGGRPKLRYRVEKISLRYGQDFFRQNSIGMTGMDAGVFAQQRPDVFGTEPDCVPITVRLRALDCRLPDQLLPFIFGVGTLTVIPVCQEWNARHEITVALAGDEEFAYKGELALVDSTRISVYTPTGVVFRRSPGSGCTIHESGAKVAAMAQLLKDPDLLEKNRQVLSRSVVEEVVGILAKMEARRGI